MVKDNEGKWMRMIWNTQIESIEKCSVSRIGAIKKHSIKKKQKNPEDWVWPESP